MNMLDFKGFFVSLKFVIVILIIFAYLVKSYDSECHKRSIGYVFVMSNCSNQIFFNIHRIIIKNNYIFKKSYLIDLIDIFF